MNSDRERYRIELEPTPGETPTIHRIRRLLKACLRAYGLRCVRVEQLKPEPPATGAGQASEPERSEP